MAYRVARVAHVVREVISDAIANRVSDPRVSRFTSVTRVEASSDLQVADVYVSVMGSEAQGKTTMKGLQSARGMIQTLVARRLDIRHCPIIRFHLDRGIKSAIETIRTIDESLAETRPEDRSQPEEAGRSAASSQEESAGSASSTGVGP